ncbi:MAG: hypothetical protein IJI36_06470, partial [Kiritimatiellae bacterium]|nr:hypothetical protein [Kiritimatiellia bacterium]
MTDGVGDLEYYFTADVDAPYYGTVDYAFTPDVGYGAGWSEQITAVTNRATYTAFDGVPTGGTDYFVRIREGESNMEWVELQGSLTVTNKVAGSNETVRLLTDDKTVPRMTLVGDHSWRYHYEVPTNAIGGTLSFRLVTKEYYTNATDATVWLTRTNTLKTVEKTVTDIPYTATLEASNPNDISVILDDASTHLKIEYNDEQRAFSLSHASYQNFNLWTDARDGFRGNVMYNLGPGDATNFVSNSGVSDNKKRYDAPFDSSWTLCPQQNTYWLEDFTKPVVTNTTDYPIDTWFSVHKTPNGWTAHNSRFVEGARGDEANLSLALDGLGEGALAVENFTKDDLPLGLDSVTFSARIAQPIEFDDFATYMDGLSYANYAISAKVTMSHKFETTTVKPDDMSPVYPSISFVGYHRGARQGCYEFRMTRTGDQEVTLELYKWANSRPTRLGNPVKYTKHQIVPSSSTEASGSYWTSAYFLLYTMTDGSVKLEGHLAPTHTQSTIRQDASVTTTPLLTKSAISFVDTNPGTLAKGGSYGIGSTDCRAGFGRIMIHAVATPPGVATDAVINYDGELERTDKLADEWDYSAERWEIDNESYYASSGGLSAVIPSNQVVQVWLSDASVTGSGWDYSGYSVPVNSFSTNKFTVSPRMPGSWKVRLQTGEDESAGVVVDDVEITPWEGTEIWGRNGSAYQFLDDWVYTKAWICAAADITHNNKPYYLPDENMVSVGTNGYVFIFNEAGAYTFKPTANMEIDRILIVGGGGAGGNVMGGGGGGGQVREIDLTQNPVTLEAGSMNTFTVGAGGAYNGGNNQSAGADGQRTEIKINGTTYTANGGGGG